MEVVIRSRHFVVVYNIENEKIIPEGNAVRDSTPHLT